MIQSKDFEMPSNDNLAVNNIGMKSDEIGLTENKIFSNLKHSVNDIFSIDQKPTVEKTANNS